MCICMNQPLFSCFFLVCLLSVTLSGMEKPVVQHLQRNKPELFVTNSATQKKVTGWLEHQPPAVIRETINLRPHSCVSMPLNRKFAERFLAAVHVLNNVYHLNMRNYNIALYLEGEFFVNETGEWKLQSYIVQKIPIESVYNMATLMVKEDGTAKLFTPGYKPQDGRPDVDLSIYKLITGHEAYTTPEFILRLPEIFAQSEIEPAYQNVLEYSNQSGIDPQQQDDFIKLTAWARTALLAKKS